MKRDKLSIKWKLFAYFSVFALIMLAILWVSETVFLDNFYKAIKTQSMNAAVNNIEENLDNQDLQTLVDKLSQQNELNISILDEDGNSLYSAFATGIGFNTAPAAGTNIGSNIGSNTDSNLRPDHSISEEELENYLEAADEEGGTSLQLVENQDEREQIYDDKHFKGNVPQRENRLKSSLVLARKVSSENSDAVLILVSTVITPVDTTVSTIRVQLVIVTIVMILLATFLAFFISRTISKPLINMNRSAKRLARGDYSAEFGGKGYLEVYELGESLNYAARELSKTETLRRELIANISHDLRTPLTMITGYAEVMRDLPDEKTPENIQIIIDEAKHLSNLVNDVLALSKLQAGTQGISASRFSLTHSIQDILRRYTKLTEQDGYTIRFEQDSNAEVEADEVKLSQVIYNLINNAVTYTGSDKLVVVSQKLNGGRVRISITDTGEGIPAENLPYIWDRYYKVDKSHKRAAVGSGIGLSIVKGILELHCAAYGVDSAPGKGSTFWFELPLAKNM